MAMQKTAQRAGDWDAYYAETDPEVRAALLSDACKAEPEEKLNALRGALWDLRYTDPKNRSRRIDRLLWQCVNLLCIYRMSGPPFLRKGAAKDLQSAVGEMGFEQAAAYGEAGRGELYREFRNAAQRYFAASYDDKSYRKKYFGLYSMKSGECKEKLAEDVWRLSTGIEKRFPRQGEELGLFSRAVKDAFCAFFPDAQTLLEKSDAAHRGKAPGRRLAVSGKS